MAFGRFKGLRFEIVGNLGVVSLIALLTTGLGVWLINGRHMLDRNLHYGRGIVESVAGEALSLIPDEDPMGFLETAKGKGAIRNLLGNCRQKDPRLELSLVDPLRRMVATVGTEGPADLEGDRTLALSFARRQTCVHLEGEAPWLGYFQGAVLVVPLFRGDQLLGAVVGRMPLDDVRTGARQTVVFILLYMGIGTLVQILFGTILISRTLVRPLERTIRVMRRVAEGDLDERVEAPGDNELGVLAATCNTMAENLKANRGAIETHVKALQRMNRELKLSQQEVIQSEKLASVGLLAAGVAHEIGNPLGAILGYVGILTQGAEPEEERSDYLRRVEKELLRIHRIVKDLREYSRPSPRQIMTRNVNEIVRDTVGLLGRQSEFREVRFELVLAAELPGVQVDEGQLQQVFVNLCLNAKDAMNRAGRIRVVTTRNSYAAPRDVLAGEPSCRKGDPPGVDFRLLRRNNPAQKWPFLDGQELVQIEVEDSGSGIPAADLPRVFDPFFTTKEIGKGTGLGLSVSQRIIESFHGVIRISSEWGVGTQVCIQLPAVESDRGAGAVEAGEVQRDGTTGSYH